MALTKSLISELEDAIRSGPSDKRIETLRRVTDLFLTGADRFGEDHIGLFDDVIGRLMDRIENRALVELGERLAPVDNAPVEVIRRLARNDSSSTQSLDAAHEEFKKLSQSTAQRALRFWRVRQKTSSATDQAASLPH